MKNKLFVFVLGLLISCHCYSQTNVNQEVMYAHYINVGQADATLLEFPCGVILIDAGAQDDRYAEKLISYLEAFFKKREDLEKTIDLIVVTHAHIDHNSALKQVMTHFKVKSYIDNGLRNGSGRHAQKWAQDNHQQMDMKYASYSYDDIVKNNNKKGITNALIDPIACDSVDPKITLLTGAFMDKPTNWTNGDYKNGNNHSVLVRIDFGKSSFLFTGDMEDSALETVINHYGNSALGMLDTDIYQAGHHGSKNATIPELVEAMTPYASVISCGVWNSGLGGTSKFNTYNYGHPSKQTIVTLEPETATKRSKPVTVKVGLKARTFVDYTIMKRIYATPWDNTVKVRATIEGAYRITRNH